MDNKEEIFLQYINSITPLQWQMLFEILPQAENKIIFGELLITKTKNQSLYTINDRVVDDFENIIVNQLDIMYVFDWTNWTNGSEIIKDLNFDYNTLDLFTLCKLITAIVRSDRFCEGYLKSKFEDQTIQKIIKGIQQIIIQ